MTDLARTEEQCPHSRLGSWRDLLSRAHCYQCTECGLKIEIPIETFYWQDIEAEAGIVGLTFGDTWRVKMLDPTEYRRRWNNVV